MNVEFQSFGLPSFPDVSNPRRILAAAGGELAKTLRDHFRARGGSFWGEIAEATALTELTETEATVSVSPPQGGHLLHKINGGTVTAKPPRKKMAIPANAQAKKAGWPSHWSNPGDGKMKPLFGKNGVYALALNQNLLKMGGKGGPKLAKKGNWGKGVVMYWLVKSVTHKPDPDALPDYSVLKGRLDAAAYEAYARMLNTGP